MSGPKFKQIEKTSGGYGFVLDKTPEPLLGGKCKMPSPAERDAKWRAVAMEASDPKHTIPPDIFEPTKCAECHVLETECPNEREVEHGTELARLNGELRELREKLFNSERRITEWAVGFVLESHGKEAERWYQDVAAEYLKETLQMDLREKQQRLARLLKHMAGR